VVRACLAVALIAAGAGGAVAQPAPTGYASVFGDYFPNRNDTTELRMRLFVEEKLEPSSTVRVTLSGFAEGLVAKRIDVETAGVARPHDANIEFLGRRVDVLAGYARVAWGKLDEIQPTDVINPLDVSRFFFEGRSEARLPVLLVRTRIHPSESISIEGIYVPDFRRGRFDRLAEPSSPFNLAPPGAIDDQPAFTAANAQGGARVSATTHRIDWSVSAYRGFESFGLYQASAPGIVITYPRFTMIGGDFEAVRGEWGVRGEVGAFVDDHFQSPDAQIVGGHSIDGGVGVDRRAGNYTLSGTVLIHSESYEMPIAQAEDRNGRSDVSFVMSIDRTFARERYRFRGFGVVNASESTGFLRGIWTANLRDNLGLEGSIGWFAGHGRDVVGRFAESDFVYLRTKYYF
jgi:hypothetical protein